MASDITDRKEYQRKLEESNERLEQFAYAASHNLQEPLRMITSYLQLLENRYGNAFDEDGEEFLKYAVDGADRMREMIDALLEYSRIETRGDPFEPVNLNEILEDVLTDLSSNQRKRAYISLYQQHCSALSEVVDVDLKRKTIETKVETKRVWAAYCSFREELTG